MWVTEIYIAHSDTHMTMPLHWHQHAYALTPIYHRPPHRHLNSHSPTLKYTFQCPHSDTHTDTHEETQMQAQAGTDVYSTDLRTLMQTAVKTHECRQSHTQRHRGRCRHTHTHIKNTGNRHGLNMCVGWNAVTVTFNNSQLWCCYKFMGMWFMWTVMWFTIMDDLNNQYIHAGIDWW